MTNSQSIQEAYLNDLIELGSSIKDLLSSYIDSLNGDEKCWLQLALGYQKDESVHNEIREILLNHLNPSLRIAAVSSLSQYDDTTDTDVFTKALEDTYHITYRSDHGTSLEEILQGKTIYPVRVLAGAELAERGFAIEVDDNGNYKVDNK